jgi:hypothetical protein
MEKKILTLHTGLFDAPDIIIEAANAPVIDLRPALSDEAWDAALQKILEADLIVTA